MEVALPEQTLEEAQPLFKKRGAKKSSAIRKRPATPPPADSDESSGYSSATDDEGRKVKRRKKTAGVTASSTSITKTAIKDLEATKFAADRSSQIELTNDATRQSNWYDESRTESEKLQGTTTGRPSTVAAEIENKDGTYKGVAKYQSFISKNPNAPSKQVGPVKAPTNIRTITVTDFAPDVCKDYKQTGRYKSHTHNQCTMTDSDRLAADLATAANFSTLAKTTSKAGSLTGTGK